MQEAAKRRLKGIEDARSKRGIMSRGKNIYNGGSRAPNNQKGKSNTQNSANQRADEYKRKRI